MLVHVGAPRGYWVKSTVGKLKLWARNKREAEELVQEATRMGMTLRIVRG